jgi:o-succinylbenzoate synthase
MKKIELRFEPYTLHLKQPISTSRGEINERKGILIFLISEEGIDGVGDCCPLPEFGSESYDDALNLIQNININLKIDTDNVENSIEHTLKNFTGYPAVKAGIEQALLEIVCKHKKTSLSKLLKKESRSSIRVNAVIGKMDKDSTLKNVSEKIDAGFDTIKIKIGRKNFADDLEILRAIRNSYGSNVKLRIDPNGVWQLNEAVNNLNQLTSSNIEYVEEPVRGFDNLIQLSKSISIPLATDESIKTYADAEKYISSGSIKAIILKPMMLGGILPTLNIINLAEEHDVIPVITSSLESSVGRAAALFAASTVNREVAHGLAVQEFFLEDFARYIVPVKSGKIQIK